MATQATVRLRWSSGALSLALHAVVIVCALLFGLVSIEKARRAPLEATLLPLPEPIDIQEIPERIPPREREADPGERPRAAARPDDALARSATEMTRTPSPLPSPAMRDVGPSADGAGTAASQGGGGLGSGGGDGAAGPGTRAGAGPVFARPDWIERLTDAQMRPFFPQFAVQMRTDGFASLACQVDAGNRARRCRVLQESPRDHGFGRAALRMSRLFRIRPPSLDGRPQYEAWVRVRIDFDIP